MAYLFVRPGCHFHQKLCQRQVSGQHWLVGLVTYDAGEVLAHIGFNNNMNPKLLSGPEQYRSLLFDAYMQHVC